jgi:hypothetical protein
MLGREIGFTDDALKGFVPQLDLFVFSPYHPLLSTTMRDDQYEVPFMHTQILQESISGNQRESASERRWVLIQKNNHTGQYFLFSDGAVDMILDSSTDYWNGQEMKSLDEACEKKIYEFYQNAVINDMQCVAFAYSPVLASNGLRDALQSKVTNKGFRKDHIYKELPFAESVAPPTTPITTQFKRNLSRQHTKSSFTMVSKERDTIEDTVTKQIFLSLVSLTHEPKEVWMDLV